MSLSAEMEAQGQWLFRWRSYLPFAFIPCLAWEVMHNPHDGTQWWWHQAWPIACWSISILGLLVRVHCVGHAALNTSGRNTRQQIADSLNVTGMYSMVRHPLYLGNFLIALGIVAHPGSFWLIGLFVLSFILYYERIMFAEEAFLQRKFGEAFNQWSANTRLFIPRLSRWTSPALPMNLGKACRQESAAVAVITVGFFLLELGSHTATATATPVEPWWWMIVTTGVIIYCALRLFKRFWKQDAQPVSTGLEMALLGENTRANVTTLQRLLEQLEPQRS